MPSGDVWTSAAARPPPQYSTAVLVNMIFGCAARARGFSSKPSVRPVMGSRSAVVANGKAVVWYIDSAVGWAPRSLMLSRPAPAMCTMAPSSTWRPRSSALKPW